MISFLKTQAIRWSANWLPAYRRTGARIVHISANLREVRIKLPLNWKTRNHMGTIFGGSMFAAVDGVHVVMLITLLGRDYLVWDKASSIRFKRPGRTDLYADICLPAKDLEEIRSALTRESSLDRTFSIDLSDEHGCVHATIEKTIHIRHKRQKREMQRKAAPKTKGLVEKIAA